MRTQIKLALTMVSGFIICWIGFGALHAQTKAPGAFWVTETLEVSDQTALLKVIATVPPTIQPFGGHYEKVREDTQLLRRRRRRLAWQRMAGLDQDANNSV
jgi:hypothetical protein